MGILHVLAELKHPAIITLGVVSLSVRESDYAAASALLRLIDEHAEDEKTTYDEVETLLVLNFLEAIGDAIQEKESMSAKTIMGDHKVRTMLDCLWWFRFLMASRPEDEEAELSNTTKQEEATE